MSTYQITMSYDGAWEARRALERYTDFWLEAALNERRLRMDHQPVFIVPTLQSVEATIAVQKALENR